MVVAPLSDRLSVNELDVLAAASAPTLAIPAGGHCARDISPSPPPPRYSRRTAAHRAAERAPLVSRRLRRLVNDRALHVAAAETGALPSTRAELRALFERRVRTAFTRLFEDVEAASAWAPFIELDEDHQQTLLASGANVHQQYAGRDMDTVRRAASHIGRDESGGDGDGLQRIDGKLRHLLKVRADMVRPLVQQVEDAVVDLGRGETVVLRLPHALSRMVAHGVAQFHHLAHRSLGAGAERVLVIRGQGHAAQGAARLVDTLA